MVEGMEGGCRGGVKCMEWMGWRGGGVRGTGGGGRGSGWEGGGQDPRVMVVTHP